MPRTNYIYSQILEIIEDSESGLVRPVEIYQKLQVSRVIVHRYLKQMHEQGKIKKFFKSPRVFYSLVKPQFQKLDAKSDYLEINAQVPPWFQSR